MFEDPDEIWKDEVKLRELACLHLRSKFEEEEAVRTYACG
jgi:hypothetical protein